MIEVAEKEQKTIRRAALTVALITNFIGPFSSNSMNIAVPHIGAEFQASATSLTWIVISFLMVTALLSLPFGRVGDIYGRKWLLKLGLLLICTTSLLNVFSPNMTVFILLRTVQGAGAAMINATISAILVDAFPANKRGTVLGIGVMGVYCGSSCGPVLGGLITHTFGWRGILVLISAIALTAFLMAVIWLPKDRKNDPGEQTEKVKVNPSSFALYILSLGLLLYGLVTLTQNIQSYFILAAGAVLVVFLVKHEMRTEGSLLEVRLFKGNPVFILSALASMLNYASIIGVAFLMSIYLQLVKGLSADISGIILISQPIIQVIISPFSGRLADKKSPGLIATLGMTSCFAALLMFSFLNEQTPLPYVMTGLMLIGLGVGFFVAPNNSVILGTVTNKDYGVATAFTSTGRTIGQVTGMAIVTIVSNAVIGSVPLEHVAPATIVQNMHISFMIFVGIIVVGILTSLKRTK